MCTRVCDLILLIIFIKSLLRLSSGVCVCVCPCVLCGCLTVNAMGAAGTDPLHNLVCGLCLAPWMADSRPQTLTHTHTHRHTLVHTHGHTHARRDVPASPTADGTGVSAQPVADGDMSASVPMNERGGLWEQHVCLREKTLLLLPLLSSNAL